MRAGGQKHKGNGFENDIAKDLSLWITGGSRYDILDRNASSGAKATNNRNNSGNLYVSQAGDIIATEDEGFKLTNQFMIECKHHADLAMEGLIFRTAKKVGITFHWNKLCNDCLIYKKLPILIARQNYRPVIICLCEQGSTILNLTHLEIGRFTFEHFNLHLFLLKDVLKTSCVLNQKHNVKKPIGINVVQHVTPLIARR